MRALVGELGVCRGGCGGWRGWAAAGFASAYNTTPTEFAAGRATLAHALEGLGRDPSAVPAALASMWTFVTDDATEAAEVLADVARLLVRGS